MAYNKVTYKDEILMDITDSTVTPETLSEGVVAYGANGERMVGTNSGSVSAPLIVHSFIDCEVTGRYDSYKSITVAMESMGRYAFSDLTALESVELVGVKSLGYAAFLNCHELKSITIPDSLVTIGDRAFEGCEALQNVYITDLEAWCSIPLSQRNHPFSLACGDLYLNGEKVTNLATLPDTVTSIGDWAFYHCNSLTNVTIPDTVTSIGDWAFGDCPSITSITIPNSVTSLGFAAFYSYEGSAFTEINYEGTVAEWQTLNTQGLVAGETTVHCTDGDTTARICEDM
jgi:hypothetical protein